MTSTGASMSMQLDPFQVCVYQHGAVPVLIAGRLTLNKFMTGEPGI